MYKEYLPVKKTLEAPKYRYEKHKKKYMDEHRSELALFERARRILNENGAGKKVTNATVADWKKEVAELKESLEKEAPQVKVAREEMLKLRGIQGTLERYLKPRREIKQEQEL